MPVHRKKKDTTPNTPGSTQEQTAPALPDPQTFQQYLRELARGAMRVVLEGVMREELDAHVRDVKHAGDAGQLQRARLRDDELAGEGAGAHTATPRSQPS